ncbi:MAG: hypothetical protein J4F39_01700 [Candidatus Latescibacteria bacterium]|nr:hypothetical protein [Candidatus Latescibacterota bacterium]
MAKRPGVFPRILASKTFRFPGLKLSGYDDVDLEILRSIIRNDLPPLIEQLESIVIEEA